MLRRYLFKGLLTAIVVTLAVLGGCTVLAGEGVGMVLRSLYLVEGLSRGSHRPKFLRAIAHDVDRTRWDDDAAGALAPPGAAPSVVMDVYRPRGLIGSRLPAVLLIPGFDRLGLDDPYIIGLAEMVAGIGVVVAVPRLQDLFEYRITADLGDQIERAFDQMSALPGVRADALGIFGLSISGGFGIAAATRPSIAARSSYSIAFAPFHDYARLLGFIATGCREGDGNACGGGVSEFGLRIFAYNYLHGLVPREDPDYAPMREFLRLQLHGQGDAAARERSRLSPAGRALLGQLEVADRDLLRRLTAHVVEELHAGPGRDLSPNTNLCNLRGALYIIHGREDQTIPTAESQRMYAHCRRCGGVSCALLETNLYVHVEMRAPRSRELSEYVRFFGFVYRITQTMLGHRTDASQ